MIEKQIGQIVIRESYGYSYSAIGELEEVTKNDILYEKLSKGNCTLGYVTEVKDGEYDSWTVNTTYTYDYFNRLVKICKATRSGNTLYEVDYKYDGQGMKYYCRTSSLNLLNH